MTTWPSKPSNTSHAVPAPPTNLADAEHEALAEAVADGSIPTFAEEPAADPVPPPQPIDPAIEREAYAALVAMINQHKDPGTEATYLEPDAYMSGLP